MIYATKPEVRPLMFVREPADAPGKIEEKLALAQMRANAAEERAALRGGAKPHISTEQWSSARWVEVELNLEETP